MITPITLLTIVGVIFLFLAAFNFNFSRISSGWMGLALIYLAILLPGFGLAVNTLLLIIAILLAIIVIVLLTTRPPVA